MVTEYTNVLPTHGSLNSYSDNSEDLYLVWGEISNGGFSIILYPDGHYVCGRMSQIGEFKEFFAFLKERSTKNNDIEAIQNTLAEIKFEEGE